MSNLRRYGPWFVLATAMALFLGGDLLGVEGQARLATALAGAALTFVGVVAAELRADAACGDARSDQHRAGHRGFVVLGAALVSTLLVLLFTGLSLAAEDVLAAAVLVGLAAFQGSLLRQRRAA